MLVSKFLNILLLALIFFPSLFYTPTFAATKKPYVVYFGAHSHPSRSLPSDSIHDYQIQATSDHLDFLESFLGSKDKARNAIFYSYTHHINGFAAMLEEEEADEISKHPDVVSVFLDAAVQEAQTTRSWDFLGLHESNDGQGHINIPEESLWKKARFGEDTIIGNLDRGVWPESESFNDDGMGPIPSRWKGSCDTRGGVRCNRKLIGARYFKKGYEAQHGSLSAGNSTARDFTGHGTHTLSIAGGRFVPGANVLGYGKGTAKGGAPNARVAAYKVCWPNCTDADILAGFDQAIHDGVDILSVSIGRWPRDYLIDAMSIGSFHATLNGILVACPAGNAGPNSSTIINVAPWIMTVAASTIDREFPAYVHLGNGQKLKGQSHSTAGLSSNISYPLIISGNATAANSNSSNAVFCNPGSLDPAKVEGKIVVCEAGGVISARKGQVVKEAGGAGMIVMQGETTEIYPAPHFLPAVDVGPTGNFSLRKYYDSTPSPTAYITRPTTVLGVKPAPRMAAYSSKGPNPITPEILKPDITAPGVNIIAAFTMFVGPSNLRSDPRRLPFAVISGTSMSCPHVSGIAALLKSLHSGWTPAAIKSAIMTTAETQDNTRMQIIKNSSLLEANPFSYGAGHVNPNSAADPGLVYDLTVKDYFNFLCAIGYNQSQIAKIANQTHKCDHDSSLLNFNYPSITVPRLSSKQLIVISRRVKNVGSPSTYFAKVTAPTGIDVSVQPKSLKFDKMNEERTFKVSLQAKEGKAIGDYVFGKLLWSDGTHDVGSPIVVRIA